MNARFRSRARLLTMAVALAAAPSTISAQRPDGMYAEIHTTKGRIVARLEHERTPMTVANFVGLAEGTIANAAFDAGTLFYDGTVYHRVVPGHVIQTGAPRSERAGGPGYTFPNEIHAQLSHDHAGALNMANGGPHTNSSQWCITLGDRSYLDGDYTVFGEVVEGMAVVMQIVQGDVVDSVRIVRVGADAEAFRPTTESFRAQVEAAKSRVAADSVHRRQAEAEWIASNVQGAEAPSDSVQSFTLAEGTGDPGAGARDVRYTGTALRYMGHIIGYEGPAIVPVHFVSDAQGVPAFGDEPRSFVFRPGETKINPALDNAFAGLRSGERRRLVVPAALGYGRGGLYAAEQPRRPRLVISPNTLLVYEVERMAESGALRETIQR